MNRKASKRGRARRPAKFVYMLSFRVIRLANVAGVSQKTIFQMEALLYSRLLNKELVMRKVLLSLLMCLFAAISLFAQTKFTVYGTVKDSRGEPVIDAAITVKSTGKGVYTDLNGRYTLSVTTGRQLIVVSMVGYETLEKEIDVHSNSKLDVVLRDNAVGLSNVVVYGKSKSQQIKEGAYAVNALNVKPLVNTTQSLNAIVNRTTGVRVREEGGVGSDFDLSINGMSGNSIRYFLDGMPLDTKGTGVTLANLPTNIINRVEIYKGVIPAYLGVDALGGAINIVTNQDKKNFLDASYSIGSFHTHQFNFNAQYVAPKTGIIVKPVAGINYSENDYKMKNVQVRSEDKKDFITKDCRRFHDDYLSLFGQLEVGITNKKWADALFVSGSFSKTDKELQTGATQSWVYGMAERKTKSANISARYNKSDFLLRNLDFNVSLSQTWDHSQTIDTTYRKYYWDGSYINGSYSEIRRRGRSWRHYKRPMTIVRSNIDYRLNSSHSLNLNYMLNRVGNKQYDAVDDDYVPTNDALVKHILGFSYNQTLFNNRMSNVFFVKDYINHLKVGQTELPSITGSSKVKASDTENHLGYGVGSRYVFMPDLALKASYEHSVRLPISRELLGNGATIYPNVALQPESSENFNVGVFGTVTLTANSSINYEANGFIRLVDNYIQATVLDQEGMMQYENVAAVHIKGVEGEVSYDWADKLHLMVNASYQDSRDRQKYLKSGGLSATYNNRTPNKPWTFVNGEASYTLHNVVLSGSRLKFTYDYQWVHWFYLTWEAYGSAKTKPRIPNQNISNVSLLYSWNGGRYNLSLECNNLFDKLTYDNYMLQKPGRAFFAKFRIFIN